MFIYLITGTSTGQTAVGTSFEAVISTAMRKEVECKHFVAGIVDVTPATRTKRLLNYGNGGCDNSATVIINGHTNSLILR